VRPGHRAPRSSQSCLRVHAPQPPAADVPRKREEGQAAQCIYRASNGKRKVSTVVTADGSARFLAVYSAVLRGSMTALRKIKKSERKKKHTS
jgi:hypothetical protein